ncbi:hypothetical protein NPIL_462461 [Nephila pilipes]|uniref:Uncharacterized protein n=1 Tax=Nephila pilipes TaxID=299642 RepID=A0A8X6IH68_NEPPI|nr:hypothetical protein NPIL_462461 [Nephila pilipes]
MSSSELSTTPDSCDSVESASPTPVALRTRSTKVISQISFTKAACIGLCKICHASFGSPDQLRSYLASHKPNKKRNLAIQAIDDSTADSCTNVVTPHLKKIHPNGLKRTLHPLLEDSTSSTNENPLPLLQDVSPTSQEIKNLVRSLVDKTSSPASSISSEDSPSMNEPETGLDHINKNSPMASPAAYRMPFLEVSSHDSSTIMPSNMNQNSILLSVNLKMKKLPTILSPIMSPSSPKSPDILDLILTQPATLSDSSPEPQSAPDSANLTHLASTGQKIISYAEAAQKGLCKMCNTYVPPRILLNHINLHRPCTKRHKCIKAAQKEPSCAYVKPKPTKEIISAIEEKFRGKFPVVGTQ